MKMKTINMGADDMLVIADPECAEIVRNILRFISCDIHDEDNKKQAIREVKKLCTDKYDFTEGEWVDVGSLSCRCNRCGCKNAKKTRYCPSCNSKMINWKGEEQ